MTKQNVVSVYGVKGEKSSLIMHCETEESAIKLLEVVTSNPVFEYDYAVAKSENGDVVGMTAIAIPVEDFEKNPDSASDIIVDMIMDMLRQPEPFLLVHRNEDDTSKLIGEFKTIEQAIEEQIKQEEDGFDGNFAILGSSILNS